MILINKIGKKKKNVEKNDHKNIFFFFFNDCQTVNQISELIIIIHDNFLFYDIYLKFFTIVWFIWLYFIGVINVQSNFY